LTWTGHLVPHTTQKIEIRSTQNSVITRTPAARSAGIRASRSTSPVSRC